MFGCSVIAKETLDNYTHKISMMRYYKDYNVAMDFCNKAISEYPEASELYVYRGTIYEDLGNKRAALADFDKAIQLDPKNEDAYFYRGSLRHDMDSPQSAYKDLTTCIQLNPNKSHCYGIRALVRMDLGDYNGFKSDLDISNKLGEKELQELKKDLQ